MLIETLTGHENFPGMSSKAHLFAVPSRAFPGTGLGEQHLFACAKSGAFGIRTQRQGGSIAAAEGASNSLGFFMQTSFEVPEGIILKVFAQRKTQAMPRPSTASVYIRLRQDAALHRIEIPLTAYHKATLRNAYVEGRFDILRVAEAEELGVKTNPLALKFFNPPLVRSLMVDNVLSPELRAPVLVRTTTVINSAGQEVKVADSKRKRLIDI